MTEWSASEYSERSALQKWVADRCLAGLSLSGSERVLDVGCGDGKITAEIAERLPAGSILGIDPSTHMVDFARRHFGASHGNLAFAVGDASRMEFAGEFDLVVSFNALHWVPAQGQALRGIATALKPAGRALLQFVPQGERKSLEDVIEETRMSPRWSRHFPGYHPPYLHLTPEEYRRLAERNGLRVEQLGVTLEAWDFGGREGFAAFAEVTFVEWTRMLPPAERAAFIADVLDRYRRVGDGSAADAGVFHFYQMRAELRPAETP